MSLYVDAAQTNNSSTMTRSEGHKTRHQWSRPRKAMANQHHRENPKKITVVERNNKNDFGIPLLTFHMQKDSYLFFYSCKYCMWRIYGVS